MIKIKPGKLIFIVSISFLYLLLTQNLLSADAPALPQGLGGTMESNGNDDQPGLPPGLGSLNSADSGDDSGPSLPAGLISNESAKRTDAKEEAVSWPDITGFAEIRSGFRLQDDLYEKNPSIGETRLQLEMEKQWKRILFEFTSDIYYDLAVNDRSVNIDKGRGFLDLRKLSISFSAFDYMDIKAGRQILTWGTGDLVFINDLFPKDWQSFLIGRDTEYLKAPSDAIKLSIFTDPVNIDLAYTPKFDSDRFITGERLSYWNGFRIAGSDNIVRPLKPDNWIDDDELAVRLSKNLKGNEFALYGYRGYWKSPGGLDPASFKHIFPKLNVYGFSIRGQVGKGIGNIESGYYDSSDESAGNNPFINNSQTRFLAGYEQDLPRLASDLTVGIQYYMEHMMDYDEYLSTLPIGSNAADEDRHLFTLRITKLYLNQNLIFSLFTYYSPSDDDLYVRPNISYKISDNFKTELGVNLFSGEYPHTFFGQFHDNTSIFVAFRYSF
ncbi:hypothetical protein ACFL1N_15555 [Thermodesulfobacteriota bacterium]